MAHRVRNVKMRNRAEFRGNRSKRDRGIAIVRISIWQPSAISGFLKIQNINGQQGYEGERASSCKILWQSVKPLPIYGDFLFFKMAPTAILNF